MPWLLFILLFNVFIGEDHQILAWGLLAVACFSHISRTALP